MYVLCILKSCLFQWRAPGRAATRWRRAREPEPARALLPAARTRYLICFVAYNIVTSIFAIIYRIENVRIIFLSCSFYSDCYPGVGHHWTKTETFHDLIYCVYCWLYGIHIFMYGVYRNSVMLIVMWCNSSRSSLCQLFT